MGRQSRALLEFPSGAGKVVLLIAYALCLFKIPDTHTHPLHNLVIALCSKLLDIMAYNTFVALWCLAPYLAHSGHTGDICPFTPLFFYPTFTENPCSALVIEQEKKWTRLLSSRLSLSAEQYKRSSEARVELTPAKGEQMQIPTAARQVRAHGQA